jgi:hypothetical protein
MRSEAQLLEAVEDLLEGLKYLARTRGVQQKIRDSRGNSNEARGGVWTQVAECHLTHSATVTITSAFVPFPSTLALEGKNPKVLLRIQSGIEGARAETFTLAGNPKSLSGTDFYVQAQVFFDELGQEPALPIAKTQVVCGFADGFGQDLQPTSWVVSVFPQTDAPTLLVGPGAQVKMGPTRMRQAQGYNFSSNPTYLMFFDWPQPGATAGQPPPVGSIPNVIVPIPGKPASPGVAPYFSQDNIESKRDFTYGIYWAASSTGDVYTFDSTATVHVETEVYHGAVLPR